MTAQHQQQQQHPQQHQQRSHSSSIASTATANAPSGAAAALVQLAQKSTQQIQQPHQQQQQHRTSTAATSSASHSSAHYPSAVSSTSNQHQHNVQLVRLYFSLLNNIAYCRPHWQRPWPIHYLLFRLRSIKIPNCLVNWVRIHNSDKWYKCTCNKWKGPLLHPLGALGKNRTDGEDCVSSCEFFDC